MDVTMMVADGDYAIKRASNAIVSQKSSGSGTKMLQVGCSDKPCSWLLGGGSIIVHACSKVAIRVALTYQLPPSAAHHPSSDDAIVSRR